LQAMLQTVAHLMMWCYTLLLVVPRAADYHRKELP